MEALPDFEKVAEDLKGIMKWVAVFAGIYTVGAVSNYFYSSPEEQGVVLGKINKIAGEVSDQCARVGCFCESDRFGANVCRDTAGKFELTYSDDPDRFNVTREAWLASHPDGEVLIADGERGTEFFSGDPFARLRVMVEDETAFFRPTVDRSAAHVSPEDYEYAKRRLVDAIRSPVDH